MKTAFQGFYGIICSYIFAIAKKTPKKYQKWGGILEGGIRKAEFGIRRRWGAPERGPRVGAEGGIKRVRGARKRWRLEQIIFWFGDHICRAFGKDELLRQFEFKESQDF